MNMRNEPIRLPAVLVAVLLVVGPPAAAILNGANPKQAIATAILGLVAAGGVIGRSESIRARTDSPATIDAKWEAHASAVASDLADRTVPVEVQTPDIDLSTPASLDNPGVSTDDVAAQLVALAEQLKG